MRLNTLSKIEEITSCWRRFDDIILTIVIFLPVNTFKFEVQRSLKLHIKWIILKFKIHKETISAKLSIFTYDAPIIFFHATALISAHFTEQSKNGTPLVMNWSNRHEFIQALFHIIDISEIISILEFCSKTPCLVDWTIKTLIRKKNVVSHLNAI